MPSPTACAPTTIALDMQVGACIANLIFVNSGIFLSIHSTLSLTIPSNGSSVRLNVSTNDSGIGLSFGQLTPVLVSGVRTIPSTSSGETPASSIAFLIARMVHAPTLVSGLSSHLLAVGETPIPTAATLPLCSQTPNPSVDLYIESGGV